MSLASFLYNYEQVMVKQNGPRISKDRFKLVPCACVSLELSLLSSKVLERAQCEEGEICLPQQMALGCLVWKDPWL